MGRRKKTIDEYKKDAELAHEMWTSSYPVYSMHDIANKYEIHYFEMKRKVNRWKKILGWFKARGRTNKEEKKKAYHKAYYEANKEKRKACRDANKEKEQARDKAYRETNRDAAVAQKMWEEGYLIKDIAQEYNVTHTTMQSQIQRWRKKISGSFPIRKKIPGRFKGKSDSRYARPNKYIDTLKKEESASFLTLQSARQLFNVWNDSFGSIPMSTEELFDKAKANKQLKTALFNFIHECGHKDPNSRNLGYALRSWKGRIVSGLWVEASGKSSRGRLWTVRSTGMSINAAAGFPTNIRGPFWQVKGGWSVFKHESGDLFLHLPNEELLHVDKEGGLSLLTSYKNSFIRKLKSIYLPFEDLCRIWGYSENELQEAIDNYLGDYYISFRDPSSRNP